MLKIRLVIIDSDTNYSERLRNSLNARFDNDIEVYHFNGIESFTGMANGLKPDVILVDESLDIKDLPKQKNVGFAYLCSSGSIATYKNEKAVSKYQKIDDFYKSILDLYSDKDIPEGIELMSDGTNSDLVLFTSPVGGVGTSTLAISYAVRLAKHGKKPLYLNLQVFGDTLGYFDAPGNQNFSDVIFALKSKKVNLSIKIQSSVKLSKEGVYYFDSCRQALDMLELNDANYQDLFENILNSSLFDCVVVDTDFSISRKDLLLSDKAKTIVAVSDGSYSSNKKIEKMLESISILDNQNETNNLKKVEIYYNRFSSKTSSQMDNIRFIGGVKRYEGFPIQEIVNNISSMSEMDKI